MEGAAGVGQHVHERFDDVRLGLHSGAAEIVQRRTAWRARRHGGGVHPRLPLSVGGDAMAQTAGQMGQHADPLLHAFARAAAVDSQGGPAEGLLRHDGQQGDGQRVRERLQFGLLPDGFGHCRAHDGVVHQQLRRRPSQLPCVWNERLFRAYSVQRRGASRLHGLQFDRFG